MPVQRTQVPILAKTKQYILLVTLIRDYSKFNKLRTINNEKMPVADI